MLKDNLEYMPAELKFGTSGLRGLATEMTDLECYINVAGFLDFLKNSDAITDGSEIFIAGDLRNSTPRIIGAVNAAISDAGYKTRYFGLVPTPTLAFYAQENSAPCIMVTGSHIPADRNGIKFYKTAGELLKGDEPAIFASVAKVRKNIYDTDFTQSNFDEKGSLKNISTLPAEESAAAELYKKRYLDFFGVSALSGKKIVFYQHSAVGRDLLVDIIESLGASVTTVGRTDTFVSIDTENITEDDQRYFDLLAAEYSGAFAIVSTDGDSDRPFVIDEKGVFYRGDILGAIAADWLEADYCAYPISTSDAVDTFLKAKNVAYDYTKIGSPYVIDAMDAALGQGSHTVVGWEVNGGFLLASQITRDGKTINKLPTRDALLPILVALIAAKDMSIEQLFSKLPARFTQAGLIDDFPQEVSKNILETFSQEGPERLALISKYFNSNLGFGGIKEISTLDGIRIYFDNGDIAHIRPSGNAPQLRIYSVADTQERANQIVKDALAEPRGIFRSLQTEL